MLARVSPITRIHVPRNQGIEVGEVPLTSPLNKEVCAYQGTQKWLHWTASCRSPGYFGLFRTQNQQANKGIILLPGERPQRETWALLHRRGREDWPEAREASRAS